jgi:calcineurin-like phosphoesterase
MELCIVQKKLLTLFLMKILKIQNIIINIVNLMGREVPIDSKVDNPFSSN